MQQSKQTKAGGYLSVWADLTELTRCARSTAGGGEWRVTTNDMILYAMGRAILKYPLAGRGSTRRGRWSSRIHRAGLDVALRRGGRTGDPPGPAHESDADRRGPPTTCSKRASQQS